MSFLVLHMDKFKKEAVRGIQSHNERERESHSNPDIDYERSGHNYDLYESAAGNYAEAVRLLEQARAAEPGDPTIADHLGDALWKAGRKIEARHAWASATALAPDAKLSALLAKKLDFGLDVALASK